jgi:hypothetical protein
MSVTGMKQGRKGRSRNKASRGRESLEAQHSRVGQTRCGSLAGISHAGGSGNLMGGSFAKGETECLHADSFGTDKRPGVTLCTRGQRHESSGGVLRCIRSGAFGEYREAPGSGFHNHKGTQVRGGCAQPIRR